MTGLFANCRIVAKNDKPAGVALFFRLNDLPACGKKSEEVNIPIWHLPKLGPHMMILEKGSKTKIGKSSKCPTQEAPLGVLELKNNIETPSSQTYPFYVVSRVTWALFEWLALDKWSFDIFWEQDDQPQWMCRNQFGERTAGNLR